MMKIYRKVKYDLCTGVVCIYLKTQYLFSVKKKAIHNKNTSYDVHEGKTVFVMNLSFDTKEEKLTEVLAEYGKLNYTKVIIITHSFIYSSFISHCLFYRSFLIMRRECRKDADSLSSQRPKMLRTA